MKLGGRYDPSLVKRFSESVSELKTNTDTNLQKFRGRAPVPPPLNPLLDRNVQFLCTAVAGCTGRRNLRSHGNLLVSGTRMITYMYGPRRFAVSGPRV